MHVVRVFDNPQPGTIAGVVALQSVRALEALFTAKRQHLRADAGVSIEPNRTRAQRLAWAPSLGVLGGQHPLRSNQALRRAGSMLRGSSAAAALIFMLPDQPCVLMPRSLCLPLQRCHSIRRHR